MKSKLLVAGAGSWGTALALVLARNGHHTYLWGRDPQHMDSLKQDGCNQRYLPQANFPPSLYPIIEFTDCPRDIDAIVLAVPCAGLRATLDKLQQYLGSDLKLCLSSKGMEAETHLLGHEVVEACLGSSVKTAVLSGPSFAKEVAADLPTAVTIASSDTDTANLFADYFRNDRFRTYTHDDIIGVEIGAAIKNVMAIAAGIADGLGYGANTRAALITRGLTEVMRLGVAMGARQETFMGLAGLGDLILTCTDDQSRNRRLGLHLAKGDSIQQAEKAIGQAIEGLRTANEACVLAERFGIEMPISEQVLKVINGDATPKEAVQNLLQREPKAELKG